MSTAALKHFCQRSARKLGYDLTFFDRMRLLRHFGINVILDVGANVGQYALEMRALGYRGKVVSFEPLDREFHVLSERAKNDGLWSAVNYALGDYDGTTDIHVSANSVSSSLSEILPRHVHAFPSSAYVNRQRIRISRLDSIFGEFVQPNDRVLLKLDTQGHEYRILQGGKMALQSVKGIQMEMSLVPLYEGECLLPGLVSYVASLGFSLMSIEPVVRDRFTGQLLAVDGIFYRDEQPA